jgi:hypothetical protein
VFAASRLSSEANERYDGCGVAFKVTSQAAIAADPRKKFVRRSQRLGKTSKPAASKRYGLMETINTTG